MDSGKLPNYRSSYLLRFHPYPRFRLSARERVTAALNAADDYSVSLYNDESFTPFYSSTDSDDTAKGITQNLNDVVGVTQTDTRERRLSISSLVVDLALLARKASSGA